MSETTQEDTTEQQCSLDDIEHYLDRRLIQVQEQYQKNKEIKTALDSFSSLLEQLYTDEGRATAVLFVQQKHDFISKEYIDKAIRTYETQKKFDKLAQLAKNAGIEEQLLATYEHRGNLEQAAAVAKHLGSEEKATTLYNQAIDRCVRFGLLDDAAQIAQDAGLREKAQGLYTSLAKRGKTISPRKIELYEWLIQKGGDISSVADRIIEVFEYTGRFEQAAEIAEKQGLLLKALENYERAGQFAHAGEIAEQMLIFEKNLCNGERTAELLEHAITNYCKADWTEQAVKLALQEGKKEMAICIYEDAGQTPQTIALAKEIGLQRTLMFYEKAGWYKDAMEAVKNTEFSSRESLYKALHILSTSSFEVSLPEIPLVPQKTYIEQMKSEVKEKNEQRIEEEVSEEEQFLKNLPPLKLINLSLPKNRKYVQLPPVDESQNTYFPREESPSSWFLSRVGLNVVSSLTTDAIKKYLPFLLTIFGISGSGYYAAYHGQDEEKSAASVSVSPTACPPKETLEGKFCRTYQWDHVLRKTEQRYDLPEGLLAGLAIETYCPQLLPILFSSGSPMLTIVSKPRE